MSHVALLRAAQTGRVTKEPDGSYDVEKCRAALAANTHPIKSKSARKPPPPPPQKAETPEASDQGSSDSLAEAVRRKECALARLRELEVAEKEGHMANIEDVARVWGRMISSARARFLRIPSAIGQEVAQENEAAQCAAIIHREIYEALQELADGGAAGEEQSHPSDEAEAILGTKPEGVKKEQR